MDATFIVLALFGTVLPAVIAAPSPTPQPERWSVHWQATDTQQYHGAFAAAYSGPQSLADTPDAAETFDATLFLGARLDDGVELYVNPELDRGFGLGHPGAPGSTYDGTFGAAGFFSGEAYKVGSGSSYGRVQRIFVRKTFNYGGDTEPVESDLNQLGGSVRADRLTLTAGKYSVVDIFDTNPYAHDPKNDFLNWTIVDMGSFDYAADAWGYTYGVTGELARGRSTLRAGAFQLSLVPNTIPIDPQPFRQWSPVVEYEQDTSLFGGHPGAVKALVYGDCGYMGAYADAIEAALTTGGPPSTLAVEDAKHWKIGAGLNLAQEIAPHVGVFGRFSAMNGTWEAFEFTDVDRSASGGISVDGGLYHRPNDTFGVATAFNAISAPAQQYLADGGLGILIGDGNLSYAGERIVETYYRIGIGKGIGITGDYQRVWNPGYDLARGPVSVYTLRLHVEH